MLKKGGRHTQFSHSSHLQSPTAPSNAPLSPQYTTTHQITTSAFARLNSLFHRPPATLFSTKGLTRYTKKARAVRYVWPVKLSGSE